jgi:nucleoside-diphosphate-sugar epimerase
LEHRIDVRDAGSEHFVGVDAVIHLAGMSNDPAGDLNPDATYEVNHRASTRLAEIAREAGVRRFLFSSSCSTYGAHGDDFLDESAEFLPVTPYGESKVLVEQDLYELVTDDFTPTYLRNATAYGVSERLRGDLVVNNLTGFAVTTGQVFLKSDGSSWRPLVHIEDISRAFGVPMHADRATVHDEAFNVGDTEEIYKTSDVAETVGEVTGAEVTMSDLEGPMYMRLRQLQENMEAGTLSNDLRWLDGRLDAESVSKVTARVLSTESVSKVTA